MFEMPRPRWQLASEVMLKLPMLFLPSLRWLHLSSTGKSPPGPLDIGVCDDEMSWTLQAGCTNDDACDAYPRLFQPCDVAPRQNLVSGYIRWASQDQQRAVRRFRAYASARTS